jgi:hypothetical protein
MPYTDSDPATAGISFMGVWIHDPLDPEGTVIQLLHGSAARSRSVGVEQVGTTYAGRSYPVFDFGDQRSEVFQVRVDVGHGTTWRSDMDALADFALLERVVVVRDGRGRSVPGAMTDYEERDQPWGTAVSFTVTRAHEETVTA